MSQHKPYLLGGRIVTMTVEHSVIPNGYILIEDGTIARIYERAEDIIEAHQKYRVIETHGSIYPGMIDLHNHFVYNVLPLWVVPASYENRSQWPRHSEYRSGVRLPIKTVIGKYSPSAKALVRYVETKALLGGTTTGQGIRTRVKGGSKLFIGAMRNVEEPLNDNLRPAGTRVPDLHVGGATAQERIDSFRRLLNRPGQGAYFYHLSEGIDEAARQHFFNLKDHDLINQNLVGIHCLGLAAQDLKYLTEKGAKVVWSPFSNQLLYGRTIDLNSLKESGVKFSIGCDWTPTGSKNLLQELKVAAHANSEQGSPFSSYDLVHAVTAGAAHVTGWADQLGTIEEGKLADLLIVRDKKPDAYLNLIAATEPDVELVVVAGVPRYGNRTFMHAWHETAMALLEDIEISGQTKALFLHAPTSEINDVSFAAACETLEEVMSDLYGYVDKMDQESSLLLAFGEDPSPEFSIELDNEFDLDGDIFREEEHALLADVPMVPFVDLDSPIVEGANYWQRIESQKNIPDSLRDWLKACYVI
ncbi:5'-deoxyadenosine deaminase [Microbulbifer sp. NBRC 101763]|uniref:amidohydrolase family protein n=1 Tax=Microbulbifer sp. NBRC 101763 TaxID=1113820 RepID=UPI0030B7BA00